MWGGGGKSLRLGKEGNVRDIYVWKASKQVYAVVYVVLVCGDCTGVVLVEARWDGLGWA